MWVFPGCRPIDSAFLLRLCSANSIEPCAVSFSKPYSWCKWIAPLALCIFLQSDLAAQQSPSLPPPIGIETLPKRFVAIEWQLWSSPFRPQSYTSSTITKYVLPFAALSGALIATDHKTGHILPNTADQMIWSGRVSQFGAWYSVAGISGATYLVGQLGGNARAKETGLLGLEALGHAQIAVFALKQASNRGRPVDNDGSGGFWQGGNSFPSGHAASSFAVATVFAYEYSDHIAVPIGAYSLAALVSASRVSARRHWISDVVVGGSLGFLIGRFTYKHNHQSGLPGQASSRSERLIPQVGLGGSGLALSWRF